MIIHFESILIFSHAHRISVNSHWLIEVISHGIVTISYVIKSNWEAARIFLRALPPTWDVLVIFIEYLWFIWKYLIMYEGPIYKNKKLHSPNPTPARHGTPLTKVTYSVHRKIFRLTNHSLNISRRSGLPVCNVILILTLLVLLLVVYFISHLAILRNPTLRFGLGVQQN